MINNYLSPQAVSGCSFKKLFVQPYKESIYNLKLTFSAREKITFITSNDKSRILNFIRTMHKRVKHLVAATLLIIPVINTITQLFLRLFNRDINTLKKLVDNFANENSGVNFTKERLLDHAKKTLDITKFGLCTKEFESRLFKFYIEKKLQINVLEMNKMREEKEPDSDNVSSKINPVIKANSEEADAKKPEGSLKPVIQTVKKNDVKEADANKVLTKDMIDFVDVFVFPYLRGENDPLDPKREGLMQCAKNKFDVSKLGITWQEFESRMLYIYIEKNIEIINNNVNRLRKENPYPNELTIDFNFMIDRLPEEMGIVHDFLILNALTNTLPIDFPGFNLPLESLKILINEARMNIEQKDVKLKKEINVVVPLRNEKRDENKLAQLAIEQKLFFEDLVNEEPKITT